MAGVVGVGGLFVKAPDVEAWKEWYQRVLGLTLEDFGGAIFPHPKSGYTILSPFAAETTYFAPSEHAVMLNLIVDDIDGLLIAAEAAGVTPLSRMDDKDGRFAWLLDPAGVKIELWEPPTPTIAA
jgi:predicted enzyme related to lactoylglutathione lyase